MSDAEAITRLTKILSEHEDWFFKTVENGRHEATP